MPITQKTILALYGELHALSYAVEAAYNEIAEAQKTYSDFGLARSGVRTLEELRSKATQAERAAIEVILEDAPKIQINPITGDIG